MRRRTLAFEPLEDKSLLTVWVEVGDAGDLPGSAQTPAGGGALTQITGTIDGQNDRDMFAIAITDPGAFSAFTNNASPPDTQLFLFDSAGNGVLANDDDPGGSNLNSGIPVGSFTGPAGQYFIAVSNYNDDPLSVGGLIFPTSPFSGVYGPTGPGGGSPISGWTDTGFNSGSYQIDLTGASFVQLDVDIDIKPGSDPNSINTKSKGVVPLAILGSEDFDVTTIDVSTLRFGPDGAEPKHQGHLEDVNGDGYVDLVAHFRQKDTGIAAGDTEASLTGELNDGTSLVGTDSIRTTPSSVAFAAAVDAVFGDDDDGDDAAEDPFLLLLT